VALAVDPPPDGGYPHANTAEGQDALFSLTSGAQNTAIGYQALYDTTTGLYNTAVGYKALNSNNTGGSNTAVGVLALNINTIGVANTASGYQALNSNITGNSNTATGQYALYSNSTGSMNTATGASALAGNTSGSNNTALGGNALGHTNGSNNIGIGYSAGIFTRGDNNIDIGNNGHAGESGTIRVGTPASQTNTYIAGISGTTVAGGVGVVIDNQGHLGTITSSARYKEAVKPMDKASEAILSLKPVTFHYKKVLDPDGIPQFGLVAEEVEKVDRDLVARDAGGKAYTVRYEAVNAMLLNEFLKEHKTVQEQGATIAELKKEITALTATVKDQAAQMQKVSAQLEANKPAPQVVKNP
jgi:hypothetical protein